MLEERDKKRLIAGLSGLAQPLTLHYSRGTGHGAFASRMEEFLLELEGLTGEEIVVNRDADPEPPVSPGFTLSAGARRNIRYCALPEGPQSAPFVDAALGIARGANGSAAAWTQELAQLQVKANLWVLVGAGCQHCPAVVKTVNLTALASPLVNSVVVDAQEFSDLSKRVGAKAVPYTVVDGGLAVIGALDGAELVQLLRTRGSDRYGSRTLSSYLETGRVEDAVRLVGSRTGQRHLALAWQGSSTALRIGLMLVSERVLGADKRALDEIVPELCALLVSQDAALRGDTADLLGRIGHPDAANPLRALLDDPNPDVAEIAAEALEAIDSGDSDG